MKNLETPRGRLAAFALWLIVTGLLVAQSSTRMNNPIWLTWLLRILATIFAIFFVLTIYELWREKDQPRPASPKPPSPTHSSSGARTIAARGRGKSDPRRK